MPQYRKKGTEVQAIKFTGDNYKVVETWGTAFGVLVAQFLTEPDVPYVAFETDSGPYWISLMPGDYIVRPVRGEHYIQPALQFEAAYEEDV